MHKLLLGLLAVTVALGVAMWSPTADAHCGGVHFYPEGQSHHDTHEDLQGRPHSHNEERHERGEAAR